MDSPPPSTSSLSGVSREGEGGHGGDHAQGAHEHHPVMPADGHQWRKYGQKYIIRIGKIRSYFKCRNRECQAKKKAEWPPSDSSSLRIVYEGSHNHPERLAVEQEALDPIPNPYDLVNQVLGSSSDHS